MSIGLHIKEHEILGIPDTTQVSNLISAAFSTWDFQESVLSQETTNSGLVPLDGSRYLVVATASGLFAGHEEELAVYNSGTLSWDFYEPDEGWTLWDESLNEFYFYNDTYPAGSWVKFPTVIDHGTLAGLSDDDHSQYLLLAGRGGQTISDDLDILGNVTLSGLLSFVGNGIISTTSNGDITLAPNGTGEIDLQSITQIGSGIYSWTFISGQGDLGVQNDLEVLGESYILGGQTIGTTAIDDTDSPYSLLVSDFLLFADCSDGAVTVDLPSAQAIDGRHIKIKDTEGMASVNNITITTEGAETIDGANNITVVTDYACVDLISDGSNWFIV